MNDAFKPRPSIFLHRCANCVYAKKTDARGTALTYKCMMEERPYMLSGAHICDVDLDKTGEQINWFEDMKEDDE